mmetsp:Transcript_10411/g.38650  ORF Transcript_10411/g.38650 Transcript_10411/m.38650 type:complete len:94 (-) Transcript_10411:5079-5360(-)
MRFLGLEIHSDTTTKPNSSPLHVSLALQLLFLLSTYCRSLRKKRKVCPTCQPLLKTIPALISIVLLYLSLNPPSNPSISTKSASPRNSSTRIV